MTPYFLVGKLAFVSIFVTRITQKVTEFDEILRRGGKWPKEQSVRFLW